MIVPKSRWDWQNGKLCRYIIEKKLFPYIPFYIARYEKDISSGGEIDKAVSDLIYFRDALIHLYQEKELSDGEIIDLMGLVNTIITHITNGNKNEERLVNVMGGTVMETESDKIKIRLIIELGQEDGLDDDAILKRLQEKIIGLPLSRAEAYLAEYGKRFA